jgi:hypothetical protein
MATSDPPAALQRYADRLVTGTFRDTTKLWDALNKTNKQAANLCLKAAVRGTMDQRILDAVSAAWNSVKKASSNRGRSNLSRTAAPAARPPPKGDPQLSEMTMVDEDVFFIGDTPAPLFDLDQVFPTTTGITFASATKAGVALVKAKKAPTKLPCLVITKKIAFDNCSAEERRELKEYFNPSKGMLHFKEKNGPPKPFECLYFQLGAEHVDIRDVSQDDVVVIDSVEPALIKLAITYPNHRNIKDFDKNKDVFVKEATAAIGDALLARPVKFIRTKDDYLHRKKNIQINQGVAFTTKENLQAVMRKSGGNDYIVQEWYKNDAYSIIRLKEEPTLDNAKAAAKNLAEHAFGPVLTEGGFAVRVKAEDRNLAYCLYNEQLTSICGVAIIGTPKADAQFFQVQGVPLRMSDIELAQALVIARNGQTSWKCHPETRLGPPRQGFKTILVKAADAPPKCTVKR